MTAPPITTVARTRPCLDRLDAQADEPVVDQDVVARPEHLGQHGRLHRQCAVAVRSASPTTVTSSPLTSTRGSTEAADPELRPLQVGDERERPAGALLARAHERGAGRMLFVGAVGEVEPRPVHSGRDERVERLGAVDAGPIVHTIFVRRSPGARSLGGPAFTSPR